MKFDGLLADSWLSSDKFTTLKGAYFNMYLQGITISHVNLEYIHFVPLHLCPIAPTGQTLYNCRELSTNPTLFEKTNPIFPIFRLKTMISKKTKPIQSQLIKYLTQTNPVINCQWSIIN